MITSPTLVSQVASDVSAKKNEQLHEKAEQWVAQTFFGTLMKQMRQSPFKVDMFSGGRGGEAFTGMLDQQMVEHLSKGVGGKLVDSIAKSLQKNTGHSR